MRKISTKRPSIEKCATIHCHKWGPLPPNEIGRIAQQVRKREVKKEGKNWIEIESFKKQI